MRETPIYTDHCSKSDRKKHCLRALRLGAGKIFERRECQSHQTDWRGPFLILPHSSPFRRFTAA